MNMVEMVEIEVAAATADGGASINNETEYDAVIAEVERLFGAPQGSADADRFARLAASAEAYEKVHHAIGPPSPAAARHYEAEKRGLYTQATV